MYNKIIRYVAFLFLVIIIYSCRSESINFFVLTVESTLYGEMTCNGFVDVDELPNNLMQKLKSSGYKDGENVIAKLKIKSNSETGDVFISSRDKENEWIWVGVYSPLLSQSFSEWNSRQKQVREK